MKVLDSPFSQIAWQATTFKRAENGTITVPDEAVPELVGLGCKILSGRPSIDVTSEEPKKGKGK